MQLSEMTTEELKALREKYKKKVDELDNKQMAFKILLNSAYGAIGSPYFRFFNTSQAEGITLSGQVTIQTAERGLNAYFNKLLGDTKDRICAIDTDSVYLVLDDLVDKVLPNGTDEEIINFLDTAGKTKIKEQIDKSYDELFHATNSRVNKMEMKREVIASAVFVNKKRYFMKVYDSEGVRFASPKMKVKGLEAVRSTTPEIFRDKMKELFMMSFECSEDDLIDEIEKYRQEVMSMPIEKYSSSMGANNLAKAERSTGTIHYAVKAALLYNELLVKNNLETKYEKIKEGEKVKICPLVTPNPWRASYFAFPDVLPPEMKVEEYIDREGMFKRSFLEPMRTCFEVVGWGVERQASLDAFFG